MRFSVLDIVLASFTTLQVPNSYQHLKITEELKKLEQQTNVKIPIAVFSMNIYGDGISFESGFLIHPTI